MNLSINNRHSGESSTTTSTPRCFKYASPPRKVLFSPTTTRRMPYKRQAPVPLRRRPIFSHVLFFLTLSFFVSYSFAQLIDDAFITNERTWGPEKWITREEENILVLHMSHGDNVVYIVLPWYAEDGRRPAFCRHEVSPCRMAVEPSLVCPLLVRLPDDSSSQRHK